jgi:hypothetical protein
LAAVETVIIRIYYDIDRGRTGKLTQRQFCESNFLVTLQAVDDTSDINLVRGPWGDTSQASACRFSNAAKEGAPDPRVLFVQALLRAVLPVLGARHGP